MKTVVHALLRKAGFEVKRIFPPAKSDPELDYLKGGRIPWSRGYFQARDRFICEVLYNPDLLQIFQKGIELPQQFGVGFDERCIEYPWLLSQLRPGPVCMLDAGSALNHAFLLNHPLLRDKKLHIITLAPEGNCFWHKGISYLYDDLRNIPIRDNYYDVVACISTLEHIGLDNTLYVPSSGVYVGQGVDDFLIALLEMQRVLKPGGKLFITVPFGRYHNFGTFQQFDQKLISRIIDVFGSNRVAQTYFRYTVSGWNFSTAELCADAEYVDWIMIPPDQRSDTFPAHPDQAAAARAVACLLIECP